MNQILVIDDDATVLDPICKILEEVGYGVRVAQNGEEGIEVLNRGYSFDLVITDSTMPGMDGIGTAK